MGNLKLTYADRSILLFHSYMYLTCCLNAAISIVTGVAEGTIKGSYKDLYPYITKIIPNWYAKEEDLKSLSGP